MHVSVILILSAVASQSDTATAARALYAAVGFAEAEAASLLQDALERSLAMELLDESDVQKTLARAAVPESAADAVEILKDAREAFTNLRLPEAVRAYTFALEATINDARHQPS